MAEQLEDAGEGTSTTRASKRKKDQAKAYAAYKILNLEAEEFNQTDHTDIANEFISEHLAKTAELYPKIHKRNDYAPIDAKHFKKLAALGLETASKFKIGSSFDLAVFANKMRDALAANSQGLRGFDARVLKAKEDMQGIFSAMHTAPFEFMYGALNPEGFEVKPRVKKVEKREKAEPTVFIKATQKDSAALETHQDATPKEVDLIYKRLKVKSKQTNQEPMNILENILDPTSFGQSVENLFHFSFLVKDGKVSAHESSDSKPMCKLMKPSTLPSDVKDRHQSILSFDMDDYKRWLEVHKPQQSP